MLGGAVLGAICVLPFYQGLWTACAHAGFSLKLYPANGLPLLVSLCAVGAAIGAVYALAWPFLHQPGWRGGVGLGVLVSLAMWFVIAPLLGVAVAGGWHPLRMLQTLTINVAWGTTLGIALPPLLTWWTDRPANLS